MPIRAIIFDFDGLILDTETPEYQVLQDIYHQYGSILPIEKWAGALGASLKAFDPFDYLETITGMVVNKPALLRTWKITSHGLIEQQPPMPGVVHLLERARAFGLKIGLASSSSAEWVTGHLTRLGLKDYFEVILTANDVLHIKPHPELYLSACQALGTAPQDALALEDSPNGIKSAKAAGLLCYAVLNPITRLLDTSQADQVLESLEQVDLSTLAARPIILP